MLISPSWQQLLEEVKITKLHPSVPQLAGGLSHRVSAPPPQNTQEKKHTVYNREGDNGHYVCVRARGGISAAATVALSRLCLKCSMDFQRYTAISCTERKAQTSGAGG